MESHADDSVDVDIQPIDEIVDHAFVLINTHSHFRGRARRFEFCCHEDVLIVRGSVPSYYLKQVLQCTLSNIDGVRVIDNQVTVVETEHFVSPFRD
jgi:hypothetical protein